MVSQIVGPRQGEDAPPMPQSADCRQGARVIFKVKPNQALVSQIVGPRQGEDAAPAGPPAPAPASTPAPEAEAGAGR
jgi:hypothetical protein